MQNRESRAKPAPSPTGRKAAGRLSREITGEVRLVDCEDSKKNQGGPFLARPDGSLQKCEVKDSRLQAVYVHGTAGSVLRARDDRVIVPNESHRSGLMKGPAGGA